PRRVALAAQLLRTLGRTRLQRERTPPLLHLGLDVPCPLDLDRDAGELQLGPVASALEAADAGRLLDHGAPLGRAGAEDLLDLALADDGDAARQAHVREQLDEIGTADRAAGDEVLAFPAAVEPAHQRHTRRR